MTYITEVKNIINPLTLMKLLDTLLPDDVLGNNFVDCGF